MEISAKHEVDPQSWSIDRVVQELCYNAMPIWSTPQNAYLIPERELLEHTVRQNHVDGDNLLALDMATLKEDLGISSFGQRRAIMRAIEQLRLHSSSYQSMLFSADSTTRMDTAAYNTPQITQSRPSYGTPPIPSNAGLGILSATNGPQIRSPSLTSRFGQPRLPPRYPQLSRGGTPSGQNRAATPVNNPQSNLVLPPEPTTTLFEQLDLLSAGADAEMSQNGPNIIQDRYLISPDKSSTVADVRKKRKVVPTLISRNQEPNSREFYLSQESKALQETFYYKVPTDWQHVLYAVPDDDTNNFYIESGDYPPGRRRIAATQIRNYLLRPAQSLPQSKSLARIPYSQKRLQRPSDHYFTLFPDSGDRPRVCRVDDFPVLKTTDMQNKDRSSSVITQHSSALNSKRTLEEATRNFDVDGDEDLGDLGYLLAKYPIAETDELLPVYGESGDEGELDEQTWKEYEEEKAEKEVVSTAMTKAEVEATIDETLEEVQRDWRESKMPKFQLKAYRTWKQCAKQKNRQVALKESRSRKDHSELQLKKLKEAILKDTWHRRTDVKHQCQNLELTTLAIEEHQYLIQILLSNEPPLRPTKDQLKVKPAVVKQFLEDGEEVLETESDTNGNTSDDFLDDTSDGGSIHHEPEEDDWDPIIPKQEPISPATTMTSAAIPQEPAKPLHDERNLMTPTIDFNDNDADIETDSDDHIETPASRRKKGRTGIISPTMTPIRNREQLRPPSSKDSDRNRRAQDAQFELDSSDLDSPSLLPKTKFSLKGRTKGSAIDLTLSSPHSEADHSLRGSTSDFNVLTPDLNPDLGESPAKGNSDTDNCQQPFHDGSGLPEYDDRSGMLETEWASIEEISDGRRALAKAVYSLEPAEARGLANFIHTLSDKIEENQYRDALIKGLIGLVPDESSSKSGFTKQHRSTRLLALLFLVYNHGVNLIDDSLVSPQHVQDAFNDLEAGYQHYFALISRLLQDPSQNRAQSGIIHRSKKRKKDAGYAATEDRLISDTDLYTSDHNSDHFEKDTPQSHKKRKRAVIQSQEAKSQQKSDQQRIGEQERRRKIMETKFSQIQENGNTVSPINFTDPIVFLDNHIARRVKPHQLNGIQFLWREIIEDPKHQGCILAHTMGLGKTMQVISLLVTIEQCNKSEDSKTQEHIPTHLRTRKTMILCPASLLDNWYDELMMWSPEKDLLGDIYKINTPDVHAIRRWHTFGGILLLSYERFARFVNKSSKDKASGSLLAVDLEEILLKDPALVIADEAHKMKNPKSALAQATKRFKTLSRIALTGSPLNNHLEEYHTMIDWIAPGYLGNMKQFRAKYSEPINEGLYADSSRFQKRVSLRKLHVLKRDLDPKINRADISAIEKDMPTKTEYFITIDITELQKKAYNIYVKHMLETDHGTQGRTRQTRLWGWIAILQLLLNHPSCCVDKLRKQKQKPLEKQAQSTDDGASEKESQSESVTTPEDSLPNDVTIDLNGRMSDAMQKVIEVFDSVYAAKRSEHVDLSYRTSIVHDIVKEAIAIGDKTLIFSHTIPSLNYLSRMLKNMGCKFIRLDGGTKVTDRQAMTKMFNNADRFQVFLISMRAGGLGMNLQGANRVIIFDFSYNPSWEEQAIGRAYRLGQRRSVYVYRFRAAGTFESVLFDKSVFKTQMFQRVIDQKNPMRHTSKSVSDWLFPVKETEQHEFDKCMGKDPKVLDRIIKRVSYIQNVELTETFTKEDDEELNEEDVKAAEAEFLDEQLRRENPKAWHAKQEQQQQQQAARMAQPARYERAYQHSFVGQRGPQVKPVASAKPVAGHPSPRTFEPPPFARSDLNRTIPHAQASVAPNLVIDSFRTAFDDAIQHLQRPSTEPRRRSMEPDRNDHSGQR